MTTPVTNPARLTRRAAMAGLTVGLLGTVGLVAVLGWLPEWADPSLWGIVGLFVAVPSVAGALARSWVGALSALGGSTVLTGVLVLLTVTVEPYVALLIPFALILFLIPSVAFVAGTAAGWVATGGWRRRTIQRSLPVGRSVSGMELSIVHAAARRQNHQLHSLNRF